MSLATPKVRVIRWLPPAENTLLGIVNFFAEDKPEAAALFAGQVRAAVGGLATLPHRARAGRGVSSHGGDRRYPLHSTCGAGLVTGLQPLVGTVGAKLRFDDI